MIYTRVEQNGSDNILSVISILGLLYSNIVVFWAIDTITNSYESRAKLDASEIKLSIQSEYNKQLMSNHENVKRITHDFKHQLQGLHMLCKQKNYNKLEEMLDGLTTNRSELKLIIDTGNSMLDAVISAKIEFARDRGIDCVTEIVIPSDIKLHIIELCSIIGNILDNATEACLRSSNDKKKFVFMLLKCNENVLLGEVKNTIGVSPMRKGD
jgi:sensor histidine kinase regulating citrate/malate metabolism